MQTQSKLVSNLKNVSTMEQAFELLDQLCPLWGLQSYIFTQIDTKDSPSSFKIKFFQTTYPGEWYDIYMKSNYLYVDPIAKRVMSHDVPFYWSEYLQQLDFTEDTLKMMSHAQEFGLNDGVGCSYLRNNGQLFTLTMARDKPFENYDHSLLAEIYLVGAYLVDIYQKQHQSTHEYGILTEREKDIASLAAIGKTDAEIAILADISINTVRYHWKNIFNKMDSYSRVFAIIRALNLGYIPPHSFEITTNSGSVETYQKPL